MNNDRHQRVGKAEVLAALVNGAQPMGMGFLHAGNGPMTKVEAQEWIDAGRAHDTCGNTGHPHLSFDYVRGRPIKCDISGDKFDPRLYDRDQGDGAAGRVIAALRAGNKP